MEAKSVTATVTTPTIKTESNSLSTEHHHIRWAPLTGIPLERRLQMLAVCIWMILALSCCLLFIGLSTYMIFWPVLIAYVSFLYFDKAPENGGRRFESTRHWVIWRYFASYFPVKLIKVKIQQKKNYLNYVFIVIFSFYIYRKQI